MYKNELYERGEIMPRYLETSRMVADALTKQLSGPQDSYFFIFFKKKKGKVYEHIIYINPTYTHKIKSDKKN
jgi:hypothetical protein